MKGHLLCLPCTVRAAYEIASKATENEKQKKKVLIETIKWLAENPDLTKATPTVLHTFVSRLSRKITGNPDPFKSLKEVSNKIALNVIPFLEQEYKRTEDFKEAFKLAALGAICGNTIDFEVEGHGVSVEDLEPSLFNCLKGDLAIDDTSTFMKFLSKSKKILYLLDNAGEIVFDKFFIKIITENFPVNVWAAVKDGPILNDATIEDAKQIRLEEVAEIITTGNDYIGLKLDESSKEFLKHLHEADLIIVKGQGYYESITEVEHTLPKPITYILQAKCVAVAEILGVPHHGNIVKIVT